MWIILRKKAIDLVKKTAYLGLVTKALACSMDADTEASSRIRPVSTKIEMQVSPSDDAILAKYKIIRIIGLDRMAILEELKGINSFSEALIKLSKIMDVIDYDQVELPPPPNFFDVIDGNEPIEKQMLQKPKEPFYVSYINKKKGKNKYK